jgi:opacity protein-like surface antigen
MQRISRTICATVALGACAVSTAALADNPVGFYIGAGAGYSSIRSDDSAYGSPGYFNDHQTAWKGIIGIRPISLVGLEAEYIDFGQPGHHHGHYDTNYYGEDSHPRAGALFAMGYLPIPLPYLDIYGKAGAARLKTTVNSVVPNCDPNFNCTAIVGGGYVYRHDETDTKFAYGVGVQSRFPFGLTLRGEYERISSSFGDPDAFTVSATWTF